MPPLRYGSATTEPPTDGATDRDVPCSGAPRAATTRWHSQGRVGGILEGPLPVRPVPDPIRHGDSHRSRHLGTVAAAALGSAGVLAYAWWATGVRSFTAGASIAVAVPVVIVATVALGDLLSRPPGNPAAVSTQAAREADQGRGRRHRHDAAPWLVLLLVTLILEGTALVLGGRSADVPTLSTVVDHGLRWHWLRLVLFCGWLCIGALPLVRARLRKQRAV